MIRKRAAGAEGDASPSARGLPLWKKISFAAVTALLVFAALEGMLILAGVRPIRDTRDPFVGFDSHIRLFVEETGEDGRAVLRTARNKLPWFNEQRFPKEKPPETYRIVCLGGSTTYGRPYDDTTSFAGWLRELLPLVDPSRKWEVINAGGISYASYRVAALMEELAEYDPDLFIVYSGHNEFLEERTYGEMRRLPAPLLRTAAILSRTRTHAALSTLLVPAGNERAPHPQEDDDRFVLPGEVDALLDRSVGPTAYRRDDDLRLRVLEHYELNLSRMADIAHSAGTELLFVTPASNLRDCSPFKSEHREDLGEDDSRRWTWLYERGRALEEKEQWHDALALYLQAQQIDDRYAALHYRLGRVLYKLDRIAEAQASFERAVDEDVCPLRALTDIPEIVTRVGRGQRVPIVDFASLVRDVSVRDYGHPVPGAELFLDHVHPTIEGHRLLGAALVERLVGEGIVEPNASWPDEALAAAGDRIEQRIDPELHAAALRNLAKVLAWAGRHHEAGSLALQALETLPADPESLYLAACYLSMVDRLDEAVDYFRRVLPHRSDDPEAHQLLADTLVKQGDLGEALVHYSRAARLDPDDAGVHHRLGAVLAQKERFREAVPHYRRAVQLAPNDADIHFNLGLALARTDETAQALSHYAEALRLRPEDAEAHRHLGELLAEQDRLDEAIQHYLRLRPDDEEAHRGLQEARERQQSSPP